jgi:Mg-chelatase subunit ChlD
VIQGRRAVEEFYDREFERILPVTYEGPEELQRPALALVLLLDRSGSMGEAAGAYRKIDLLKRAAMEAVERLEGRNLIGIIAFDARYEWLVPITQAGGHKEEILRAIDDLYPNGGTDVYNALEDAIEQLQGVQARVKHILVFSDGKVARDRRNFERLFREIEDTTVSASSIAIGPQADFEILSRLADVGRGKLYPVRDARDLPEITLEEIVRVERARWIKGPVPVEPGPEAFELQSVNAKNVPPVSGYVLTFEKPSARTPLVVRPSDEEVNPLVSFWRYGLGKVLVLNTSLQDEEMRDWLRWPGLGDLTAELLGKVYSESALRPEGLDVQVRYQEGVLTITVDAQQDGRWLDGLALEGRLSPPEGRARELTFEQIAPGRYRAIVTDLKEGVYLVSVGEESLGWVKTSLSVPYPREYRRIGVNFEQLMRVAQATGGEYLEGIDPQGLQALLEGRAWTYRDLWQPLGLAALALFLLDLVVRKLPLGHSISIT